MVPLTVLLQASSSTQLVAVVVVAVAALGRRACTARRPAALAASRSTGLRHVAAAAPRPPNAPRLRLRAAAADPRGCHRSTCVVSPVPGPPLVADHARRLDVVVVGHRAAAEADQQQEAGDRATNARSAIRSSPSRRRRQAARARRPGCPTSLRETRSRCRRPPRRGPRRNRGTTACGRGETPTARRTCWSGSPACKLRPGSTCDSARQCRCTVPAARATPPPAQQPDGQRRNAVPRWRSRRGRGVGLGGCRPLLRARSRRSGAHLRARVTS